MNNDHNHVKDVAKIVCGYCINKRGLFTSPPYKALLPTERKINDTYQYLCSAMGVRGRFTEPKTSVLIRSYLFTPEIFEIVAPHIELICSFNTGIVKYWNGYGAKKNGSIEDNDWNPSPFMEYQVDIAEIWDQIMPYLEP